MAESCFGQQTPVQTFIFASEKKKLTNLDTIVYLNLRNRRLRISFAFFVALYRRQALLECDLFS